MKDAQDQHDDDQPELHHQQPPERAGQDLAAEEALPGDAAVGAVDQPGQDQQADADPADGPEPHADRVEQRATLGGRQVAGGGDDDERQEEHAADPDDGAEDVDEDG